MASDLIEEEEFDTGPELLQVEQGMFECCVAPTPAGHPCLYFTGYGFPSLQDVDFGIQLKPGVTTAEAQVLADLINQRSVALWAQFWDRPKDGPALYEFGENGLAKLR
jgi:hypothetical protein